MYTLAIILIIIASLLLVILVLAQNSKGGGLSTGFVGGNQFGGVAETNKFLVKATWILAVAMLVLSIVASISIPKQGTVVKESQLKELIDASDLATPPTIPSEDITTAPKSE